MSRCSSDQYWWRSVQKKIPECFLGNEIPAKKRVLEIHTHTHKHTHTHNIYIYIYIYICMYVYVYAVEYVWSSHLRWVRYVKCSKCVMRSDSENVLSRCSLNAGQRGGVRVITSLFGRSIVIIDFSTLTGHVPEAFENTLAWVSKMLALLTRVWLKTWNRRSASLAFFCVQVQMYPFSTAFFFRGLWLGTFRIGKVVCLSTYQRKLVAKFQWKGCWEWVEEGRNVWKHIRLCGPGMVLSCSDSWWLSTDIFFVGLRHNIRE